MNFPNDLRYTSDHEWIRIDSDQLSVAGHQVAYVGITDFAQSELDELVYVEVESVGEVLDAGEIFGTVEAVKTTSDLFMPVDAKVLEFNPKLSESGGDDPGLINRDPYGEGWIVKIEIMDATQLDGLMDAEAYQKSIK